MSGNYGIRRRDGNSSEAIAAILHPNEGYREKLRRKGITPKDYERENKLRLKQIQAKNREQRQREAAQQQEAFKLTRFKGIRPRVFQQQRDATGHKHEFLRRNIVSPSKPTQESTSNDGISVYQEGDSHQLVASSPNKLVRQHLKAPVPSLEELEERNKTLAEKVKKEKVDYVNANAWEVIKKAPAKPPVGTQHLRNTHSSYGRIPAYLLKRKEQWAKEEEERRRNAPDPNCPPGMMMLDEEERLRTLDVLHKSLAEARLQINKLPLRIETPRQIRRKNALEAKLHEIEDAIKVFDRSKVYVAIPLVQKDEHNQLSSVAA